MFVLTNDAFVEFVFTIFFVVIICAFFTSSMLRIDKILMNVIIVTSITKTLSQFAIAYISFRNMKITRVI